MLAQNRTKRKDLFEDVIIFSLTFIYLWQEGFYCGGEDGDWGASTEKALQLFLKDAGYDVDFKKGVRDGGRNTELFQEFLQDEDQECKPDGSWGKKSAMALQNFLKNEDEKTFDALYKGAEG